MTIPRVVCAITHTDEITLGLCRQALERQGIAAADVRVISNVRPASSAFNQCLDFALEKDADILLHVAADCILSPGAVADITRRMDLETDYAVVAQGFDIINGSDAPIGAWALNMRVIADRYRFRDAFKMDLDFCERIEAETSFVRKKTFKRVELGYHHPIWLPREFYQKFRYNAPKYRGKIIRKHMEFLDRCLNLNPDNKVLQIGVIGLKRGSAEPHDLGGPRSDAFESEWRDASSLVGLEGGEFFAYHQEFIDMAKSLLGSSQDLKPTGGYFYGEPEMKKESTALGTRLALATKRVRSRGKQEVLGVIRGGYRLLPEPAKKLYRRIRGRELLTPAVRIRQVTKDSLPSFAFGSITGGRIDWAEKWQSSSRDKRVLLIAPKDFAGSMYKWTEALNRHSQYAARLVTFEHHQYGYPVDLVVPECDEQRLSAIVSLADEAGLLHLKDEHSWFLGDEHFTNLKLINTLFFSEEFASWPKIFTHYGGYARKFKADPRYIDRVSRFDSRIAMTPDLNYEWFSGEYIPHTIDIETIPFAWVDGKIFAHSPSSPEKKATYLFEEAMVLLPQEHPAEWEGWRTELIHGVSFAECMRRKQQASLFFDQAGRHRVADLGIDDIIGWYGNSAIEAMAFGIPTMAHMSDFALERAAAAQVDLSESPVINIGRTRKSLMDEFLKFARAGNDERFAIAQKTRAFTESFHGYDACATRLAGVYSSLTSQGKRSGDAEKISSV